ncbi:MAG TPA: 16S rRNA (uracil(1498)-N(3))-methyltransferase [Steroidobacteraceae bacterium]|nr:16S rRNA (uracil(1498)-N(3))-methyltransferase [Steroidobacteraceae bacterium]
MRLTRLHVAAPLASGSLIDLPPEAAVHLARVLRARGGDALVLFNGDGREFAAVVESVRGARVAVAVGEERPTDRESPLALTLLQCIPRGDRMDWIVQKATELGVQRIVPLVSRHVVVKLSARQAQSKAAHWRAVAVNACEQCGRTRLPAIDTPRPLDEFLGAAPAGGARLLLDPDSDDATSLDAAPAAIECAVGPEGGFAPEEIECLRIAGFRALRLGPRILRTETAALAALVSLQLRCGDLRRPS